jgi:hypothetical protein
MTLRTPEPATPAEERSHSDQGVQRPTEPASAAPVTTDRAPPNWSTAVRHPPDEDECLQPWDRPQAPQNAVVLHRYDRHSYVNNADDGDYADDAIATATTAASTTTTTPLAAHEQTVEEWARPRRALASANCWALARANPSVHAVQRELEHRLRQLPDSELDEWVQRAVPHMKERYRVTYRFPLEPPD